jgi:hypothetical protein
MNKERIRELTFKAGAKLYSEPLMREVTGVSMSFESVDQLGELIVQECAEFARQHNLEKADRSYMIHRAMKEHFGVKE